MSNYATVSKSLADTYPHTPASAVAAGDVVVVNGVPFVANNAIAASALGSVVGQPYTECAFPKATGAGTAIAAGDAVLWDTVSLVATLTPSATSYFLGRCTGAAATTDSTVKVAMGVGASQAGDYVVDLAANTTLTARGMHGKTFTNSAAITASLPAAADTFKGCTATFVRPGAFNFIIDPAAADGIYFDPDGAGAFALQADGVSITLAVIGDSITLVFDGTNWQRKHQNGAPTL